MSKRDSGVLLVGYGDVVQVISVYSYNDRK